MRTAKFGFPWLEREDNSENTSVISRGADELAYKRIEPYLSDYMGAVFEEISKQHLWNELLNLQRKRGSHTNYSVWLSLIKFL